MLNAMDNEAEAMIGFFSLPGLTKAFDGLV